MTGITGESAPPALAESAASPLVGEAGQAAQLGRVRFRRFAVAVISCVLAGSVLVACSSGGGVSPPSSSTASSAAALPDAGTPAGAQLAWLLTATSHLPILAASLRAHFDASFLAQISPAKLNQAFRTVGAVEVASVVVSQPRKFVATVGTGAGRLQMTLVVDAQGRISSLGFGPVIPQAPTTWAGVDAAVRSAAPQVRLLVAEVTNGSCRPVHSIDPSTPAPLGSAFKLYVLDALARAVAVGKVSWTQPLTVTAQLKSLPSGQLQTEPDRTKVSVQEAAAKMISISDNTAADMLINLVGRPTVEAALTTAGMADPARDQPFLTTRELFTLKLDHWPALADRYLAASQAGRGALLATVVDRAPLPPVTAATGWTTPRDINSIEWFASANDICHVYASLAALARRPGLSPVAGVLQINDGGLGLNPAEWKTTWFKGGSEPGVLTLTYMATTRTGHSYVVAVLADKPSAPINEATAVPAMLSAVKGAFTLAAHG
jgi:beta-lactamase class A